MEIYAGRCNYYEAAVAKMRPALLRCIPKDLGNDALGVVRSSAHDCICSSLRNTRSRTPHIQHPTEEVHEPFLPSGVARLGRTLAGGAGRGGVNGCARGASDCLCRERHRLCEGALSEGALLARREDTEGQPARHGVLRELRRAGADVAERRQRGGQARNLVVRLSRLQLKRLFLYKGEDLENGLTRALRLRPDRRARSHDQERAPRGLSGRRGAVSVLSLGERERSRRDGTPTPMHRVCAWTHLLRLGTLDAVNEFETDAERPEGERDGGLTLRLRHGRQDESEGRLMQAELVGLRLIALHDQERKKARQYRACNNLQQAFGLYETHSLRRLYKGDQRSDAIDERNAIMH